jgi:hypothetical protein
MIMEIPLLATVPPQKPPLKISPTSPSLENKKERQLKDQTSPSKEVLPFFAGQYERVFKVLYDINWEKR